MLNHTPKATHTIALWKDGCFKKTDKVFGSRSAALKYIFQHKLGRVGVDVEVLATLGIIPKNSAKGF